MSLSTIGALVAIACGSTGSGADSDEETASETPSPTCFDEANEETESCSVEVEETECPLGDANACAVTRLIEVSDSEETGVCVRVVIENACDETLYSETCISVDAEALPGGWQCWRSTTLPGASIDVDRCNATGKIFHYSSTSTGRIDAIAEDCEKP